MKISMALAAILMAPILAVADMGDLTPMASNEQGQSFIDVSGFVPRQDGDRTVHPQAMVGKSSPDDGKPTVAVAIDADDPQAARPNLLRVDFTGQGQFAGRSTLPMRLLSNKTTGETYWTGTIKTDVVRGQQTIPVAVTGWYTRIGQSRHVMLHVATGLRGIYQFGPDTCSVLILDSDGNLDCGDPVRIDPDTHRVVSGDRLIITTLQKKKFEGYIGQPIRVGEVWYAVTLSPDRRRMVVKPATFEVATLTMPSAPWEMSLIGERYVLNVTGETNTIDVPADVYAVQSYSVEFRTDTNGAVSVSGFAPSSAQAISAVVGSDIDVPVGPPVTASVDADVAEGREVVFALRTADSAGNDISVRPGRASIAVRPRLDVFDATGKLVHSATFEYG